MMNTARFEALKKDLARCAGLPPDDAFLATGVLKVNGLDTLLFYDEELDPERLQIRVDFGPLPSEPQALSVLMRSLLAVNFTYGMAGLAVFSINAGNDHVILTLQQRLDVTVTAQDLLGVLRHSNLQAMFAWEQANGMGIR